MGVYGWFTESFDTLDLKEGEGSPRRAARLTTNFETASQSLVLPRAIGMNGLSYRRPCLSLRIQLFHIADDGLPAIIDMDMLNADKLLPAMTQASKNLNLGR